MAAIKCTWLSVLGEDREEVVEATSGGGGAGRGALNSGLSLNVILQAMESHPRLWNEMPHGALSSSSAKSFRSSQIKIEPISNALK